MPKAPIQHSNFSIQFHNIFTLHELRFVIGLVKHIYLDIYHLTSKIEKMNGITNKYRRNLGKCTFPSFFATFFLHTLLHPSEYGTPCYCPRSTY